MAVKFITTTGIKKVNITVIKATGIDIACHQEDNLIYH